VRVDVRSLGPGDEGAVLAAGDLFDEAPQPATTRQFLADDRHHLLIAYDEAEQPVGFVSGVETIHPDKGTEMFLYELGVDPPARRHGVGRTLVEALLALARERGCYGMWTATEAGNVAARATYDRAGAKTETGDVTLVWDFRAASGD
jgi:ribosomal protein S18 acetylase RimI-like enzyme